MKTPEEIKKGLEVCATLDGDCENCPYDDGMQIMCVDRLRKDALSYIVQLELYVSQVSKALCGKESATICEVLNAVSQLKSSLAQGERERDAAVRDMENYAGYGAICKHFDGDCPHVVEGCPLWPSDCDSYEWRGVCEENTKEE